MHRDHQQQEGQKNRGRSRKEWSPHSDQEHQMEAREHARQPDRAHRTFGIKTDEAERLIRELRVRY